MIETRPGIGCACPAVDAELCVDIRHPSQAIARQRYYDGIGPRPEYECECACHAPDVEDDDPDEWDESLRVCDGCGSIEIGPTETVCLACSNRAYKESR